MEGVELKVGKQRVQENLIAPLEAKGMARRAKMTLAEHGAFLDSLRSRLAYMGSDQLAALEEVVERYARGKLKNTWPSEVSIMNSKPEAAA